MAQAVLKVARADRGEERVVCMGERVRFSRMGEYETG
jgi:hypothetical protein